MSRILSTLLLISFLISSNVWADKPLDNKPNLSPNTISLPWKTFLNLWDKSREGESFRTESYAFGKALYVGKARIDAKDYFIEFDATFDIQTFGDNEKLVPFLSESLNLESVTIDGGRSTWTQKDGTYQVLLSGEKNYNLSAKFTVKFDSTAWPRNFELALFPIAQSEVVIHVPDKNVQASFDPGVNLESIPTDDGTQIRGFLPAKKTTHISWIKKANERQKMPLAMRTQNYTYALMVDSGVEVKSVIHFRILQGQANHFQIVIPQDVDLLDVKTFNTDNKIDEWYTVDSQDQKVVHVFSTYQQNESFKIVFEFEKTISKEIYSYTLPQIKAVDVEETESFYAIGSNTHVEVKENKIARVESLDVRFLPEEINKFASGSALYYFKAKDKNPELSFNITTHEKVPLMTTSIGLVEANSVIAQTGAQITKATYHVKNNQAQYLKIDLPKKTKLLSTYLNGNEIQPGYDEAGLLLIPLIKSSQSSFPVEIAYLTETNPFGFLGSQSIVLPKTEFTISELLWTLYSPHDFQIVHFGGNVQKESILKRNITQLFGKLIRFLGVDSSYADDANQKSIGLKNRFKRYQTNADDAAENQVRIHIPVSGQKNRFSSYLISSSTPQINLYYINSVLHRGLAFFVSAVLFVFILWSLILIFEKNQIPTILFGKNKYFKMLFLFSLTAFLVSFFSLGVAQHAFWAASLSLAAFALWQNRQVALRYHLLVAGYLRHVTEIIFGLLIFALAACVLVDWSLLAAASVFSILFHLLFNRIFPYIYDKVQERNIVPTITLKSLLFLLTLLTASSSSFANLEREMPITVNPDVRDGQVFVDWDVVERILSRIENKKHKDKNKLDIGYIFGDATIVGSVSDENVELTISIPLKILSDSFVKVPLFDDSIAITEARLNKKALPLSLDGNQIIFEARKENETIQTLELSLILPLREKGGVQEFILDSPLLKGSTVSLDYGEQIKSIQFYDVIWQKEIPLPKENESRIQAALGAQSKLHVELASFKRREKAGVDENQKIKKIFSETSTLITLENKIASLYSSVKYKILNDQIQEFKISLPQDVVVHEIVASGLASWEISGTQNGISDYDIKLLYPVGGDFDVSIHYEKKIENDGSVFKIPDLKILNVARNIGFIGVEIKDNAELVLEKINKARVIDVSELPQVIHLDAASPLVYALRYVENPFEIMLGIKRRSNVKMDAAVADKMIYTHVISPLGAVNVQLRMQIRNTHQQFAEIILPQGASVLSAFLDGTSVKPSQGNQNQILLPLKRQSSTPFTLELVYEEENKPFNFLGGWVHLQYPQINISTSMVTSDIFVPENFHVSNPFGDLKKTNVKGFVSWYEKDESIQQQFQSEKVAGVLPLKIDLPKKGQLFTSNAFYVPESVALSANYVFLNQTFYFIYVSLTVIFSILMGFWLVRFPLFSNVKKVFYVILALLLLVIIPFGWETYLGLLSLGILIHFLTKKVKRRRGHFEDSPVLNLG